MADDKPKPKKADKTDKGLAEKFGELREELKDSAEEARRRLRTLSSKARERYADLDEHRYGRLKSLVESAESVEASVRGRLHERDGQFDQVKTDLSMLAELVARLDSVEEELGRAK